jgi:hypothetical protein
VIFGDNGRRIASTDNGLTWTKDTTKAGYTMNAAAFGNGRFVGIGQRYSSNFRAMSSTDLTNWTDVSKANDDGVLALTFGGGSFMGTSNSGAVTMSTDGSTWTKQPNAEMDIRGVTYGNGKFVAVGSTGTAGAAATSSNGSSWSKTTLPGDDLFAVTFGGGRFVAAGVNGRRGTSLDGANWTFTTQTDASNVLFTSVAYANSVFVTNDGRVSSDGITWGPQTVSNSVIAAGNGCFVAIGGDDHTIRRSTNGKNWTNITTLTGASVWAIAYGEM